MAGIESEVTETFLEKLTDVPAGLPDSLAALLEASKLPKAEHLAALYTEMSGETAL